jgi:uncharacterized membrane protein YqgA involved in biofilm formation
MRRWVIIRMVLAATAATFACLGLLAHMVFAATPLLLVSSLLLTTREEFTKPIPRKELKWFFLVIGLLLAGVVTLNLLHLPVRDAAVTDVLCHPAIVLPVWLLFIWGIYRRWQVEKQKADTRKL